MRKKELEKLSTERLEKLYNELALQVIDCMGNGVLGCAIVNRVNTMQRILDVTGMRFAQERLQETV